LNSVYPQLEGARFRFQPLGLRSDFLGFSSLRFRKRVNVRRYAAEEEITRAFRKMSVQWHPDKYKGDDPNEALDMQTKLNEVGLYTS
jgi:hypothetical protein